MVNLLTHLLGPQQQLNKRNPHAVHNQQSHTGSLGLEPQGVNARPWRHCPNMGYYLHPNMGKKEKAKRKPEKNSGLYGIRILDLCDTGAALYQLS